MKYKLPSELLKYAAIVLVSLFLTAFTVLSPPITWQTLFLWSYTASGIQKNCQYDSNGIPIAANINNSALFYTYSTAKSPTFLPLITASLPERMNQSNNPTLFPAAATDENYNIYLDAPATVDVSFIYEGAGYRNSLGYFAFDPDNPPVKPAVGQVLMDKIIFPNTSLYNSGGSNPNVFYGKANYGLYTGDTASLGLIDPANYTWNHLKNCNIDVCKVGIGFVLVANGFGSSINGPVRAAPDTNWVFYSLANLNPETTPANQRHMVLIRDNTSKMFAIGMEDMNRDSGNGSDSDFNDLVIRLKVSPESSIVNMAKLQTMTGMADSDNDGVPDSLDEFPNDPERVSSVWYPSKTGWNTLAYEDLWPAKGDYDMNDLVVNYRHRIILSPKGDVKEIELHYQLMAAGARYSNGFAVELTGIGSATAPDSAVMSINGGTAAKVSPITPNNYLAYKIFNDAFTEFRPAQSGITNTVKGTASVPGNSYQLNISFATPRAKSAFTNAPLYNPFLFRTGTPGLEVHLPGRPPTSNADSKLFGTQDDGTVLVGGNGPYYVSNNKNGNAGYPWALDIPQGWKWPTETIDIVTAYPNFAAWVQSSGKLQTTWYLSPNSAKVYP